MQECWRKVFRHHHHHRFDLLVSRQRPILAASRATLLHFKLELVGSVWTVAAVKHQKELYICQISGQDLKANFCMCGLRPLAMQEVKQLVPCMGNVAGAAFLVQAVQRS